MSEIISAVTVPASKPQDRPPPRHHRHMTQVWTHNCLHFPKFSCKQCQGIEGLLQENLRMGPQQGLNLGWGDDLEASRFGLWIPSEPKSYIPRRREFLPVGSAGGRSPPSLAIGGIAREEPAGTPPMPRITLRFAGEQRFFSRTIILEILQTSQVPLVLFTSETPAWPN